MYNAYSTSNLINQFVEDHADQLDMSDNDYINTVLINDVIEDTKDLGSDGFYQAFSFTIKDVENYIDTYCNNLTTN